jgi:glycerophosphoryl diester phosphodiesterase
MLGGMGSARRLPTRFPFLDAPTPIAFAHRGASACGLENSMAAFEAAVRLGYRYLEIDVRATSDGVPVVFHDPTLSRVTGRPGRVAELTWAQLARVRIGGREPVPRLDEVLGAWPDVRVNLDVKTSAAVAPLAAALRRTAAVDRVCVGAFSDARLARIRALVGPRLCTSLGPRAALALRVAALVGGGRPVTPDGVPCAQVPSRAGRVVVLDRRFVAAAHDRGLHVHVWTINSAAEMARLLDLGVDGIMTDRAELLRELLAQRGLWR